MDGSIKNKTVAAVEPVLLSPLVDQLTIFGQLSSLVMLQHLFKSYREIDEIDLEKRCGEEDWSLRPCVTPILIDQTIGKGGIIRVCRRADNIRCNDDVERDHPFSQTVVFNENILEWRRQTTNLKTWAKYRTLFH